MTEKAYTKLLEPGRIGNVKTRNRIYKTAAGMMYFHDDELHMNGITLGFYEALARGGVGLISVEAPIIDYPLGARWRQRYRMDEDRFIPGMAELVAAIHKYGCPTFMQMEHDGPWQSPLFDNAPATFEGPPIAASPVNIPKLGDFHRDMPRQLTVPEIRDIIRKYVDCAERAKKAGYDGVDINAGSSHIVHNFLSPFWNRRDDEYGGTPEKRARLMVEIIRGIKERCGEDFPIVLCINGFEVGWAIGVDDKKCLTHEMATTSILKACEAGVDALMIRSHWLGVHVAGFLPDYMFYPDAQVPLDKMPKEYFAKERGKAAMKLMVEEYKKLVSLPIILVGYVTPETGEEILREGNADFVGMNRSLMCDPELPNKLAAGRRDDIAPCTHCGTCLDQSVSFTRHCRLNAALGTESYVVDKAQKKKKVVVIGGGPAGMEAARVSALRGHDVTLIEKSSQLGGLLPLAALIKGTELEDLPALVDYLKTCITALGVKVKLKTEATAGAVEAMKPDVVFLATGGVLTVPEIKGVDKGIVMTTPELHRRVKPLLKLFGQRFLGAATKKYLPVGKNVIVIGAGLHGTETAEFLVKRGRTVTIVEPTEKIGEGVLDFRLGLLMDWFEREGVCVISGAKDLQITDKGLAYVDKEGGRHELEADTIVPTSPLKSDTELLKDLEGKVAELYVIGDANIPGKIVDAVREGYHGARAI
ncbi:MAG: FAD-dependent oxidoreductase [Syntrophorhabdales bacterium]|jgi:2,4-dienoyl-CoA reductase (NADPH2)